MRLAGVRRRLSYRSGVVIDAEFLSDSELRWSAVKGPAAGQTGVETMAAAEIAPGLHFVSWLEREGTSVSLVLDLDRALAWGYVTFATPDGRRAHFDQAELSIPPA